jgi:hypothetical protein
MWRMATILLIPSLFLLSGCGTWEKAKAFYRGYVLPAEVELDKGSGLEQVEKRLARLSAPVDAELERLVRELQVLDPRGGEQGLSDVIAEFSWVNEVVAVDPKGNVLRRHPEHPVKTVDLGELARRAEAWTDRSLHSLVVETSLGPEMVLLKPFFQDNEKKGYLMAHFDLRSLVERSPEPKEMVIFTKNRVLWPGGFSSAPEELAASKWDAFLESSVTGEVDTKAGRFFWLARYVGQEPLFYAVPAEG